MGERAAVRVDATALHHAARQYESAAHLVDTAVTQLAALSFDGAAAGRAHTARGDALRMAVDDLTAQLRQWSRAASGTSALLGVSAYRYTGADATAARRVG